ncbi:MAG TPA: peptidase M28, partial [Casimicrobiaceae bacterium]|nr:peptidase M28 [Casimicrobiaceae bacterium]
MRHALHYLVLVAGAVLASAGATAPAAQAARGAARDTANPQITELVSRLTLDRYKATVKGLTQFGDRRQGTDRNRKAVDWIEA